MELPIDGEIWLHSDKYNADQFALYGLSYPEEAASWTDGKSLVVACQVPGSYGNDMLHCDIDLKAVFCDKQDIMVRTDTEVCYSQTIGSDTKKVSFDFTRPDDGMLFLAFELPGAASPLDMGMSGDPRELALMIRSIKITK